MEAGSGQDCETSDPAEPVGLSEAATEDYWAPVVGHGAAPQAQSGLLKITRGIGVKKGIRSPGRCQNLPTFIGIYYISLWMESNPKEHQDGELRNCGTPPGVAWILAEDWCDWRYFIYWTTEASSERMWDTGLLRLN